MRQRVIFLRALSIIYFVMLVSGTAFAGAPVPWGSKLIRDDISVSGNGEERRIASYQTKASKEELFKYYLKEMPLRGYSLFMRGDQNIIFNNSEEMIVVIIPPSIDGETSFMITTASMKTASNAVNPYTAETSCDPIPSVPAYPGSRCMNSTRMKSGVSRSAAYSVEDSGKAVLDFYWAQMPRYDWRLVREINIEDVMLRAIQDENKPALTPPQEKAIHDRYGSAQGMFFNNKQGNGCSVYVMNNPAVSGGSLINIVYEEKASQQ